MILSVSQIDKNIAWLLSNGSPPVRYLTHKYLLRAPLGSTEMINLWKDVQTCEDVEEIFNKQREDGSWCSGGSWALKPPYLQKSKTGGYDPESPKYVTAIWVLPLLGDMGFTVEEERIKKACEYILSYKELGLYDRIFNDTSFEEDFTQIDICSRFFYRLAALAKVGYQTDERVKRGYTALLGAQREDGGWISPGCASQHNWTRSCPFSSYGAALALYSAQNEEYRSSLIKALEFLVWHLSTKQAHEIQRFFYHGHSTIHELMMFTEFKVGLAEKPVQVLLEWLMTMYHADEGCFTYSGKSISEYSRRKDGMDSRVAKYRLYHLIEDDWLTYYATRIGANLENGDGIFPGSPPVEAGDKR
jgi:hypothetical protein